jgi:Zn-dependent peptidase ImmA (M78 family)
LSEPISYDSEFLPGVTIIVIFSDNPQYEQILPMFQEYGYGFMIPNKNLILINGEEILNNYSDDLLKFIEAHEIAHVLLNHDGPRNEEEELDADLVAYVLLKQKDKIGAIKTLLKYFKNRHGLKFDEKLLKRVENRF